MLAKTQSEREITFDRVSLAFSSPYPEVRSYKEKDKDILIVGYPILGEKIDYEKAKGLALNNGFENFVKDINGSFLIIVYDNDKRELLIATDRFASIPFFYRLEAGGFKGATCYNDIHRLNEEAFFEFLYMRRLFGNKTYDRDTRFLDSASTLTYNAQDGELRIERYWRPDCSTNAFSLEENARALASLSKESFKRMISLSEKPGLLLSGGLDSRFVLASSDRPLVCFTTCEYKNNEYMVAGELTRLAGCEHIFVEKPATYYSDIIDMAVYIGSGMTSFENAHFLNMVHAVTEGVDALLHGYGFDFLFRGKYMPLKPIPLYSRISTKKRLMRIDKDRDDIARIFIGNNKFRPKNVNALLFVKDKYRKKFYDSLYCSVNKIFDEARLLSDDVYKQWNYCCFHNISRHFSYLNILSIRAVSDERTVAFDNGLFDLFWSMDPRYLLNGEIFIRALAYLNRPLLNVRYSNINQNIARSGITIGAKAVLNKFVKEADLQHLFKNSIPKPAGRDRSWPIDADLIIQNRELRKEANNLCKSGSLERVGFLDMDRVASSIDDHLEGRADYTNLIFMLITLNKFLMAGTI